jgi:hypothetical protein
MERMFGQPGVMQTKGLETQMNADVARMNAE